jgi:hypothetical protein
MENQPERFNTNLHKMDQQDLELRQYLKNWVDKQPLPVGGKVQLITAAATLKEEGRSKTSRPLPPKPNDLISWAMVYCVDRRISMARIVT